MATTEQAVEGQYRMKHKGEKFVLGRLKTPALNSTEAQQSA